MIRYIYKSLLSLAALACAFSASASECELSISIAPIQDNPDVPQAVAERLQSRLRTAMSQVGVVAGDYDCQFFVTGKFDNAYEEKAGGVGGQYLIKTTLSLYIGDAENKRTYASRQFDLKGVGKTQQLAYMRALSSLSAENREFVDFVESGKAKVIDYFNKNYNTYLNKARTALKNRSYEEALYFATQVPECCVGYEQANALTMTIFTDFINYQGQMLLAQAKGAWAADPTADGAAEAHGYLAQIDPSASCYPAATAFGNEIAKVVKANWDFENKEKYKDAVALERQRIEAARQIGVEWGKNQPQHTYEINWVY